MRFWLFFISVLFIQSAFASDYYVGLRQQGEGMFVTHFISSAIPNTYSLDLPKQYSSISVNVNYTIRNNTLLVSGNKISVNYFQKQEDLKDSIKYFLFSINSSSDRLFVDFFAEKGFSINNEMTFPQGFEITSNSENSIASWVIDQPQKLNFIVTVNSRNTPSNFLLFLGIFLLFLGILAYVYLRIKRHKNKEDHLLEAERKVIELLKKSVRHESWQKNMQKELTFSKAKLSRLLKNLESRNLIKRIPVGNTNKIKLL